MSRLLVLFLVPVDQELDDSAFGRDCRPRPPHLGLHDRCCLLDGRIDAAIIRAFPGRPAFNNYLCIQQLVAGAVLEVIDGMAAGGESPLDVARGWRYRQKVEGHFS